MTPSGYLYYIKTTVITKSQKVLTTLNINMRNLRAFAYVILVIMAVFYGMAAYKFELPPFGLVKVAYEFAKSFTPQKPPKMPQEFLVTPPEYLTTDVAALISIRQQKDVIQARKKLIAFLWGKPGLPTNLPKVDENYISDTRYSDIPALSRIDKLTIAMEYGIESYAYHFIPKQSNNNVVLYNLGHDQDFYEGKSRIKQLLDAGYSVVAFAMPLAGLNNQPTINIPGIGMLKMTTHDQLKFLTPANGHPVKFFVEPIVVAINYLKKHYHYTSVSMVGFSGGGWIATIAAAVDTRIEKCFPVAGSYPIYLRSNSQRDWDDYEQTVPELYRTVNYLDLYLLGASGKNRKELQILNQFDPCCFAGTKSETYKSILRDRVHKIGPGEFDLFLDASHQGHHISDIAMNRILDEIGKTR